MSLTLFLCGDVMTGRGIDQVFFHACNPQLFEPYVNDARDYVTLAEQRNGPIAQPVPPEYIWGDALAMLHHFHPTLRLVNLETSVTANGKPWPGKGVHYHMHPRNLDCLKAARIDACTLANNHVLDWGYGGLLETLAALRKANIQYAGAGETLGHAQKPFVATIGKEPGKQSRVLVFSCGTASSGIPNTWAATAFRAGVFLLPNLGPDAIDLVAGLIKPLKKPGDLAILSIHWGDNWSYKIEPPQRQFAHQLVDTAGVDLIHGHSSHHPRGIEVYKGKLILYGCGDFINDYEGISGHEAFRSDLRLMYFVSCKPGTGKLQSLMMAPMQVQRFQLQHATQADSQWLAHNLSRVSNELGTSCQVGEQGLLELQF